MRGALGEWNINPPMLLHTERFFEYVPILMQDCYQFKECIRREQVEWRLSVKNAILLESTVQHDYKINGALTRRYPYCILRACTYTPYFSSSVSTCPNFVSINACIAPPCLASIQTKTPPQMHKITPIVAASPMPIESIRGTMAALPDAPNMY